MWQGRADWAVVERARFGHWAPASPSGLVIHDTLTARIAPARAVAALAAAFTAAGGEVVIGAAEPQGAVIWATGAQGLADLSQALGREVGGAVKGQAALLDHDARALPQLFADGLHIVPQADGTVAIGSTSERQFDEADSTDAQLDTLIAQARAACPPLADAPVIARWAGLRPRARTRAPMLGHWPDRPGHYIANGGFKIGFGIAPMVGAKVMADLVLEAQDAIPQGFSVEDSL